MDAALTVLGLCSDPKDTVLAMSRGGVSRSDETGTKRLVFKMKTRSRGREDGDLQLQVPSTKEFRRIQDSCTAVGKHRATATTVTGGWQTLSRQFGFFILIGYFFI